MSVFLAIPMQSDKQSLDKAVENKIADQHNRYKLQADSGWLIKYDGTTVELCDFLEITGQEPGKSSPIGSTMVVPITTYYGRGPSDMWEWLKVRLEQ